jgi:hypothetical protein
MFFQHFYNNPIFFVINTMGQNDLKYNYIRHKCQAYPWVAISLYCVCKFGLSASSDCTLKLNCYFSFVTSEDDHKCLPALFEFSINAKKNYDIIFFTQHCSGAGLAQAV